MNNMNDKSKDKAKDKAPYGRDESRAAKDGKGYAAAPDKNARSNEQSRSGRQASPHEKDGEDRERAEY